VVRKRIGALASLLLFLPLGGCGNRVQAPSAEQPSATITIESDPLVTFEPTSTSPDGILSSSEAFDKMAPTGQMPAEESATLGYVTYPPQGGPDEKSFSFDHRLAWGFSLPNTCGLHAQAIDPGAATDGAESDTPSPSACTDTEWTFADATSGHFLFSTWQS
jgi:hypothetical protein